MRKTDQRWRVEADINNDDAKIRFVYDAEKRSKEQTEKARVTCAFERKIDSSGLS